MTILTDISLLEEVLKKWKKYFFKAATSNHFNNSHKKVRGGQEEP